MRKACGRFTLVALLGALLSLSCAPQAATPAEPYLASGATGTATQAPPSTATGTAMVTPRATAAGRAGPTATTLPPTATRLLPSATAVPPTPTPTTTPFTPAVAVTSTVPACSLPPVVAPTAAPDPGYARRDPSTGLHVTGRTQLVDLETYRLRVTGAVDRPLELTYDEIRCLPRIQDRPLLVCPDTFEDRATWAGASLGEVLKLAGVQAAARKVQFVSADGYKVTLPLERALQPGNFLAYEWENEPLPRLHGFPLRAVLPAEIGAYWVKWLVEIHVQ